MSEVGITRKYSKSQEETDYHLHEPCSVCNYIQEALISFEYCFLDYFWYYLLPENFQFLINASLLCSNSRIERNIKRIFQKVLLFQENDSKTINPKVIEVFQEKPNGDIDLTCKNLIEFLSIIEASVNLTRFRRIIIMDIAGRDVPVTGEAFLADVFHAFITY